jgi:diaminohydroxyphosphoribosylaminopyrimidine deaminase/5-amino-6-(5-phosphoribosylamino)uracil reductase
MTSLSDLDAMQLAIAAAEKARLLTPPNPWVGAVLITTSGERFVGATEQPGGRHGEIVALDAAGDLAQGATLYVTLEPCCHTGRTGPCTERIISSGVSRVVIGVTDPDSKVHGGGVTALLDAGLEVETGISAQEISQQLSSYLHHRLTGRPEVILKLAATLDGRTAAPDGTSKWITSAEARQDAHRLRSEAQVIIVGAGTVRADDPQLTVRLEGYRGPQPRRIVLGEIPKGSQIEPAESYSGSLESLLQNLGDEGVLSVLVEGGAAVAHAFHDQNLVDRYVVYVAPAIMSGDDGRSLFAGPGAPTLASLWRGKFVSAVRVGEDLRVEVVRK